MQCDMIGCKEEAARSISSGPGTYLSLCDEHYKQEERYKYGTETERLTTGMVEVD